MNSIALDRALGDVKPKNHTAQVVSGLCDSCGTRAAYEATKNGARLSFCGHHARKNAASLIERGFAILPEDYAFKLND